MSIAKAIVSIILVVVGIAGAVWFAYKLYLQTVEIADRQKCGGTLTFFIFIYFRRYE
jgi:hypothetical protein